MRIKTKLNLGVGLLFILIFILSLVSSYSVFSIKKDTGNILTANYNTLEYARNMLLSLDAMPIQKEKAAAIFELNLKKQMANITEVNEVQVTQKLQSDFNILKENQNSETIKARIRQTIFEIMKLNMNAIKVKSDIAKHTAETANFTIAVVGTLCF